MNPQQFQELLQEQTKTLKQELKQEIKNELKEQLAPIIKTQQEHTKTLAEHSQKFNEHLERLDDITAELYQVHQLANQTVDIVSARYEKNKREIDEIKDQLGLPKQPYFGN